MERVREMLGVVAVSSLFWGWLLLAYLLSHGSTS